MKNLLTCSVFLYLRCYPLVYSCKVTHIFDTRQVFLKEKLVSLFIIDINQRVVCEHTCVFTFVLCFSVIIMQLWLTN